MDTKLVMVGVYPDILSLDQLNRARIELQRYPEASEIAITSDSPLIDNIARVISTELETHRANYMTHYTVEPGGVEVAEDGDALVVVVNLEQTAIIARYQKQVRTIPTGGLLVYISVSNTPELVISTESGEGFAAVLISNNSWYVSS
jgi:hypothetical protein